MSLGRPLGISASNHILTAGLAFVAAAMAVAPAFAATSAIYEIETKITTLDPAATNSFTDMAWVQQNVYGQLFQFGLGGTVAPGLAESATVSADGKTVVMQLRKDVWFHARPEQGFAPSRPFDARDVIHTFTPSTHSAFPYWKMKGLDTLIQEMTFDAADPSVITFKLSSVRPDFTSVLAMAAFSMRSAEHYEFTKNTDPTLYDTKPVGTGPYRAASLVDGTMVLEAVDSAKTPSNVIVRPQTDATQRIQNVLDGKSQVASSPALSVFAKARAAHGADAQFLSESSQNINFLVVNAQTPNVPELLDLRARQAISMALDRAEIVREVFFGEGLEGRSFIDPANFTALTTHANYKMNLVEARKLALDSGLVGKEVTLLYMAVARPYNPEPLRLAEVMKTQLEKLGLRVRLATVGYLTSVAAAPVDRVPVIWYIDETVPADFVLDHAMYMKHVTKGPGFDLAQLGDNPLAPAAKQDASGNRTPIAVDRIVNVTTAGIGSANYARYSNPVVDRLYADLNAESDTAKREAILVEVNRIIASDLPIIPIGQVNVLRVVAKDWRYTFDSTLQIERF